MQVCQEARLLVTVAWKNTTKHKGDVGMRPADRTYLYNIDYITGNVLWYAGLGTPFKLSYDSREAVSIPNSQIDNIRKGLIKFTDNSNWYRITGDSKVVTRPFACQQCGTSWTHACEAYAKGHTTDMGVLSVTSDFRNPEKTILFGQSIRHAKTCKVCGDLICGDCGMPERGKNAGRCRACKKKSWER